MRNRSTTQEIMDDFELEGNGLEEALDKIAWINRVLGGNRIIRKTVAELTKDLGGREITITDIGCGNGDILRELSRAGAKEQKRFRMTGIDANAYTVDLAKQLSLPYPAIRYICADVLDKDFELPECDIVLLTLTLHHFTDEEVLQVLHKAAGSARLAIIVNDLHRSRLALWLFGCISRVFRLGEMNTNDGKLSIKRGFRRKELRSFAEQLHFKHYTIRWKWAFRYQWVITGL